MEVPTPGEGDALQIRAEGESESLHIRANGQSQALEIFTKTLTPEYLKYKLYENPATRTIIVPDKSGVPIIVNPGAVTLTMKADAGSGLRVAQFTRVKGSLAYSRCFFTETV